MKTLKKTLCLVLSVVMLVGVLVIPANAANKVDGYEDYDKVADENQTAVAVLVELGIMTGDEDGLRPEDTLTRAEGATLVAKMMLTPALAGLYPESGAKKFTDAAKHWGNKAIAYGADEGIINGTTPTTFEPNDTLTAVDFAKMLLVAVGVDGEFTGEGYDFRVIAAGLKADIFVDTDIEDYSKPVTRQDAAQMLFNAMGYSTTEATSVFVVKDASGTQLWKGTDPMYAVALSNAKDASGASNVLTVETTKSGSVGYDTYGLTSAQDIDSFGRSTTKWTADGNVSVVLDNDYLFTATKAMTVKEIADKLTTLGHTATTLEVYTNNKTKDGTDKVVASNGGDSIGGNGTVIEVYPTSTTGTYKVVVIDTYVQKLTANNFNTEKTKLVLPAPSPSSGTIEYTIKSGESFGVNDVVLYTVSGATSSANTGTVQSVSKAKFQLGTVTGALDNADVSKAYVRLGGDPLYIAAHNPQVTTTGKVASDDGYKATGATEYTYYFDNAGYIVYAEEERPEDVATSVVYVIQAASVAPDSVAGDDLFTETDVGAYAAQVQVVDLKTGKIEVKNLAITQTATGTFYQDQYGAASTVAVDNQAATNASPTKPIGTFDGAGFYDFVEVDSKTIVLVGGKKTNDTGVTAAAKNPTLKANTYFADAKTVVTYMVAKQTAGNYSEVTEFNTYIGYDAFPNPGVTGDAMYVVASATTGLASQVFIIKNAAVSTTSDDIWAVYVGAGEQTKDGTAYSALVNGETVQLIETGSEISSASLTKGDVFTYKTTNSKVSNATKKESSAAVIGGNADYTIKLVTDAYIVVSNSGTDKVINRSGVNFYAKNNTGDYVVTAPAVGMHIQAYGTDETHIVIVMMGSSALYIG